MRVTLDGRVIIEKKLSGTQATFESNIMEPGGGHSITAVAYDQTGLPSIPVTIRTGGQMRPRGTLWVLAVGIDQYGDPSLANLKFAVLDANNISNALVKRKGIKFEMVSIKELVGSK